MLGKVKRILHLHIPADPAVNRIIHEKIQIEN